MVNFNIKKVLAYYLLEKSNKKRPRKIKRKKDKKVWIKKSKCILKGEIKNVIR